MAFNCFGNKLATGGGYVCVMSLLLVAFLGRSSATTVCTEDHFIISGPRVCPIPGGDQSKSACCYSNFTSHCCNPLLLWVIMGSIAAVFIFIGTITACCCLVTGCPLNKWRMKRFSGAARYRNTGSVIATGNFPRQQQPVSYPGQQQGIIPVQQPAPVAVAYPAQPPQVGTYPGQPAAAYPGQQAAYPTQQTTYPAQQTAYPAQETVYPAQQAAYPSQQQFQGAYPGQQAAYPGPAAAAAASDMSGSEKPPSYDDLIAGGGYPVKPSN